MIVRGGRALLLLLLAWAARADAFAIVGVPASRVAALRHQAATSSPLRLRYALMEKRMSAPSLK